MADDSALGGEMTLAIFKLNGQMLSAGEALTRPVGLTVAWWQVLGACLREPQTASGVSRQMGISRQAVQRVANRLLAEGLLEKSIHLVLHLDRDIAVAVRAVRVSPDVYQFLGLCVRRRKSQQLSTRSNVVLITDVIGYTGDRFKEIHRRVMTSRGEPPGKRDVTVENTPRSVRNRF